MDFEKITQITINDLFYLYLKIKLNNTYSQTIIINRLTHATYYRTKSSLNAYRCGVTLTVKQLLT